MDEFGWVDEYLAGASYNRLQEGATDLDYLTGLAYSMPFWPSEDLLGDPNTNSASSSRPSALNTTVFVQNDFLNHGYTTTFEAECVPMLNQGEESSRIFGTLSEDLHVSHQPAGITHSYKCTLCDEIQPSKAELLRHLKTHGFFCDQCGQSYGTQYLLADHASDTGHESYRCSDCDARFSRLDVLKRHKIQHSPTPTKYPCTHCKKWRAPNGFARKDHLTQHLRNYHHIESGESPPSSDWCGRPENLGFFGCCTHGGCPLFRHVAKWTLIKREDYLFTSRAEYTKHMRQEHDETPFPCTKAGCKRVNGKGFFRKRDMIKHLKKEHDISEEAETEAL